CANAQTASIAIPPRAGTCSASPMQLASASFTASLDRSWAFNAGASPQPSVVLPEPGNPLISTRSLPTAPSSRSLLLRHFLGSGDLKSVRHDLGGSAPSSTTRDS